MEETPSRPTYFYRKLDKGSAHTRGTDWTIQGHCPKWGSLQLSGGLAIIIPYNPSSRIALAGVCAVPEFPPSG